MTDVNVRLLGGFALTVDGEPVPRDRWVRRHAAAVVKVLALAPGHRLHREQVADLLWPDASVDRAFPRLHKAAFFARQVIPGAVVLRDEMVSLFPGNRVVVDVEDFEILARTALSTGDNNALLHALDVYEALLPDDRYEPWVERRADALRMQYIQLLHLARRWNDLLELDPADEVAHLALAKQHGQAGNRHAALRQLERLERTLSDLGLGLSTDAIHLRDTLIAAGDTQSPSDRRAGLTRGSKHQFEQRRVAALAHRHSRMVTPSRKASAVSCNSRSPCC